jgi:Glycine cleavage system T protein (aminomethyltransferase)
MSLLSTPFHYRAVEENRLNAWETREGIVLATHYGSFAEEVLAARFGAVMGDLSWYWVCEFSGGDIGGFTAQAFTRNGAGLAIGAGFDLLWLNDAGAVRGRGWLVRLREDCYRLISPVEDRVWFSYAASLYGVTVGEPAGEGMLTLIGPYAQKILGAAGIEVFPASGGFVSLSWRGIEISLSRLGPGFEIVCHSDDALIVWDRLKRAGRPFALRPAGQAALDCVLFECGLLLPGRDFAAARDGFSAEPMPQSLGFSAKPGGAGLIDPAHIFNGKGAWAAAGPDLVLAGVLLEGIPPLPAILTQDGRPVGHVVAARHSPALQGVIGFAVLSPSCPPGELKAGSFAALPVGLPFLPLPGPAMTGTATERAYPPV